MKQGKKKRKEKEKRKMEGRKERKQEEKGGTWIKDSKVLIAIKFR
jgi:hypothetical protein